ncbi:MAG TPA: NAD(P)-dependent oxidoreductase [Firmicutes bacterium]|nr:NAD(P)-dependent oxidoreductase [Bacillota bacterium]
MDKAKATKTNKCKIGFIGLGIMGRPMAENLLKAGYELVVWNRTAAKMAPLLALGAQAGKNPADVAGKVDIVITIVGDSPDVEQVVLGPDGVLAGARPPLTLIDMTTMSPAVARKLAAACAEKGVDMLDAPVSGGEPGAIAGTLSIMVGGRAEVLERCRPVLEVLGKNIVHVGGHGDGQMVKLCNQVICGLNILATAEGLALAAKAGLDRQKVLEVVTKGAAGSWMLSNLGPKMIAGDFAPGFMVRLQLKDLRLALEAAEQMDMPLPGTALAQQLFRTVQAAGGGNEGTQAMIKALEKLGHIAPAPAPAPEPAPEPPAGKE